jgi:hypothetical protein
MNHSIKHYKLTGTEKSILGTYEELVSVFGENAVNGAIGFGLLVECDGKGDTLLNIEEAVDQIVCRHIDKTKSFLTIKHQIKILFDQITNELDYLVTVNSLSYKQRELYQPSHLTKALKDWFEVRNAIELLEMIGMTVVDK